MEKGKFRQFIKIRGANEHNLNNISVDIPRNELVVLTGLSGSGKSSLAFDTIYAEGQRRYMESLSSYARQFLGNPYVYGGNSLTNGTDCSGFVKGVYAAFGINLPRTSSEQRSVGYAVSLSEIQPGDIVCYSGHVGIYAGNNTLIHASNEKTGITLTSPVTCRSVLAVRRIF